MGIYKRLLAVLLLLSAGQVCLGAQAKKGAEKPPRKIALLGASLSKGFPVQMFNLSRKEPRKFIEKNLERKLSDREYGLRIETVSPGLILRKAWGEKAVIRNQGSLKLFLSPLKVARMQVKRAIPFEPDLVLALDFMFWFGYGWVEGDKKEEASRRLQRQQQGLKLLENLLARTSCPVILGDYPRLKLKGSFIISNSQIPSPGVIDQLNKRLRTWTASRKRVILWPLSKVVARIYDQGYTQLVEGRKKKYSTRDLLQVDRLHPTRLGTAFVVLELERWLRKESHTKIRILPTGTTLKQLVGFAGANLHLEQPLDGKPAD